MRWSMFNVFCGLWVNFHFVSFAFFKLYIFYLFIKIICISRNFFIKYVANIFPVCNCISFS